MVAVTREEMDDLVVELVTVRTNEEREEREQEREEARDVIVTERVVGQGVRQASKGL